MGIEDLHFVAGMNVDPAVAAALALLILHEGNGEFEVDLRVFEFFFGDDIADACGANHLTGACIAFAALAGARDPAGHVFAIEEQYGV